jgi:hypothetical protein
MNKMPAGHFLFCKTSEGLPKCENNANYLQCLACGNYNNNNTGSIVARPGNSAYAGQSSIYSFMCFHCHKEMMENEPGVKECAEMMKKVREQRRVEELKERNSLASSTLGAIEEEAGKSKFSSFFSSSIPADAIIQTKKRKLGE